MPGLKKIKVDAPKGVTSKSGVPIVEVKSYIIKTEQGLFIGSLEKEDEGQVTLKTDAGLVTFTREDSTDMKPLITAYNEAESQLKEAEALVGELEPVVKRMGVEKICRHNCSAPHDAWTSVKLKDAIVPSMGMTDADIQIARISSTSAYVFANGDAVSMKFEEMKASALSVGSLTEDQKKEIEAKFNVNAYVQETVTAKFDNNFFLDEKGNFSQSRYDVVHAAMEIVAKKLSTANPLTCKTIVLPKPDFHGKRYGLFNAEENIAIHAVLPNKVSASANQK